MPGEGPNSWDAGDQLAFQVTCLEMADGWVEDHRHCLPDLDSIPPHVLPIVLKAVDRNKLNGHDLVRLLEAEARLEASASAEKLASVAEIAHCPPGDANSPVERTSHEVEYVSAEIAAALRLTRRSADTLLGRALWLASEGRRVGTAFAKGTLSNAKVGIFHRALSHLDQKTIDAVLDQTLETSNELTTGQLGYRVSKLVMAADSDGARSSMQEGLKERKVVGHSNPDFTGCFHICSSHPLGVSSALRNVDRIARTLNTSDDERCLDEIRADVALALLRGEDPTAMKSGVSGGSVHLNVPLTTLADLSDLPGELSAYGPIIADIARQIALQQVNGKWTWSVTHGDEVIATGITRYRPTAAQQRRARADYPTCVHPGCRMPSRECDLDHRNPYSRGGRTHIDNLAPLCRYHHMGRHHTPREYVRLREGDHVWKSPLGHIYTRPRDPPEEI